MEQVKRLEVYLDSHRVGTMALYKGRLGAFEYVPEWLEKGFSISPFKLPLRKGVFLPQWDPFDGTFGIFADSLPDGWGRLLVDRMLQREHLDPMAVDNLTRLAIVGSSGRGALEYKPDLSRVAEQDIRDYDVLAESCKKLLQSEPVENLDELYRFGGSSGGARPKAMVSVDGEEWLVKFPSTYDSDDIGKQEYDYVECAAHCGIEVPEHRLIGSNHCAGYYACRRFDRMAGPAGTKKIHMVSVSALLELSHRIPSLDYNALMALTWQLTKSMPELEKLFRLMCFNVFAHNRDDHSKNFSYLYENGLWRLAPAYDMTYSYSIGGEHATTVNGNGKDPRQEDLLSVAKKAGLNKTKAKQILEEVRQTVNSELQLYLK